MKPFIDKADKMMDDLTQKMLSYTETYLAIIHRETGLEKFIVGGSWASHMIVTVLNEWDRCDDLNEYDQLELVANDIDVFYGPFATATDSMVVDFHDIKKHEVTGFWELNTVKCHSLSAWGFLNNNDLNVTASCFEVDFTTDQLLTIKASPRFWEFVFSAKEERTIKVVDSFDYSRYGATTC